jgi:AcrR family transcriptional regulator
MTRRRTAEEVRSAVINTAAEMIEEIGPLRFRMTELLRRANVSESVVYRHFTDRDHLVNETLLSMFAAEVERARAATEEFVGWMTTADPSPEDIARALTEGFMPTSTTEASTADDAFQSRALKARITVAALEFPEVHSRFVRLQREIDSLAELLIARIEERLGANGWATSLHSMRFAMNGVKFSLLLEDLDERLGGTSLSREELSEYWTAVLSRFPGRSDAQSRSPNTTTHSEPGARIELATT